jgi:hypothetical protein
LAGAGVPVGKGVSVGRGVSVCVDVGVAVGLGIAVASTLTDGVAAGGDDTPGAQAARHSTAKGSARCCLTVTSTTSLISAPVRGTHEMHPPAFCLVFRL